MGPEFQFRFRFQNGRKIPVIKNRSRKIFLAAGVGIIFQLLLNKMPINVSIQSRGRFDETFFEVESFPYICKNRGISASTPRYLNGGKPSSEVGTSVFDK